MSKKAAQELVDALEAWIACLNRPDSNTRTREEIEQFRIAFAGEIGGVPAETVRGLDVVELLQNSFVDSVGVIEQERAFCRVMRALVSAAAYPQFRTGAEQILGVIEQSRLVANARLLRIDLPTLAPPSEAYLELGDFAQVAGRVDQLHAEALGIARAMLQGA